MGRCWKRCRAMSRLAAEVAFHSSLLTPRLLLQVIVESDFSLPTFASCLFRLRGDSKAIAGVPNLWRVACID